MAFCDVDGDGQLELLVGSEDYEIRVFRNEEVRPETSLTRNRTRTLTLILTLTRTRTRTRTLTQVISETTETEMVVGLAAMRRATFAYALANGTIGVYDQPGQRKWRVKSKHEATAIVGFDLDGDGQPEVISGAERRDGRAHLQGPHELGHLRDTHRRLPQRRTHGTPNPHPNSNPNPNPNPDPNPNPNPDPNPNQELIVCSDDGEVKAYLPAGEELTSMGGGLNDGAVEEDTLRELHQRKQEPNPNPNPDPNPNPNPDP
eukprot:scaffold93357_cov40-Phaeocystis_antarctica.AAC.1